MEEINNKIEQSSPEGYEVSNPTLVKINEETLELEVVYTENMEDADPIEQVEKIADYEKEKIEINDKETVNFVKEKVNNTEFDKKEKHVKETEKHVLMDNDTLKVGEIITYDVSDNMIVTKIVDQTIEKGNHIKSIEDLHSIKVDPIVDYYDWTVMFYTRKPHEMYSNINSLEEWKEKMKDENTGSEIENQENFLSHHHTKIVPDETIDELVSKIHPYNNPKLNKLLINTEDNNISGELKIYVNQKIRM